MSVTSSAAIPSLSPRQPLPSSIQIVREAYTKMLKSVIPDIGDLTKYQLLSVVVLAITTTTFSFIDINSIYDTQLSQYTWKNNENENISSWKQTFLYMSGIASFSGAFSAVLSVYGKYSTFFWGMINTIFYAMFTIAYGYIGDSQLNLLFIMFQWYGVVHWKDHIDKEDRRFIDDFQ